MYKYMYIYVGIYIHRYAFMFSGNTAVADRQRSARMHLLPCRRYRLGIKAALSCIIPRWCKFSCTYTTYSGSNFQKQIRNTSNCSNELPLSSRGLNTWISTRITEDKFLAYTNLKQQNPYRKDFQETHFFQIGASSKQLLTNRSFNKLDLKESRDLSTNLVNREITSSNLPKQEFQETHC